jgi:ubiquinone/menaquinone biosynthesis C-methylase UbiE
MKHRQDWQDLADVDPLWAILSDPAKRKTGANSGWDLNEFFKLGLEEAEAVIEEAARLGYPGERRRMLDFGCGVGRVTRAFSRYFENCLGLDISQRMIDQARQLNSEFARCAFEVHDADDLAAYSEGVFDLVYCNIVLQHLPSQAAVHRYIREFVRVVTPGGLVVFQLPSLIRLRSRLQLRRRLYSSLRALGIPPGTLYRTLTLNPIRMNAVPESQVLEQLWALGATTLVVERAAVAGYNTATYLVTK